MKLTEVIRSVSPSVVAFGSQIGRSAEPKAPGFPPLIGTGFFIDRRGLIATNEHVVEAMQQIPPASRFVMLFPEPTSVSAENLVLRQFSVGGPPAICRDTGQFIGTN